MSPVAFEMTASAYNQMMEYAVVTTTLVNEQIAASFKVTKTYLKDPRFASLFVFAANFVIFEVALRISRHVQTILPDDTKMQKNVALACRILLAAGLVVAGNVGIVRLLDLKLHPQVIAALAIGSMIVTHQLEETKSKPLSKVN